MNLKKLINRRAVLTPHAGGIRCGWILAATPTELQVELSHGDPFAVNEPVDIAVSLPEETIRFNAVATESTSNRTTLKIAEDARSEASPHECRTRVHLVESISTNSGTASVDVVDISPNGVGLLTDVLLAVGSEIRLHFDSTGEPIRLDCIVRYARPEQNRYRIGLEIIGADSKSRRCWDALNLPERNMEFVSVTAFQDAS